MIKNKIISIFLIFITLTILVIPTTSNAVSRNSNYDYTIEKYNIDMVVNEDNTYDITETITANFNVLKHGIFRKIPLKNEVTRLDGTKSKNTAQITNIEVSDEFKTYNEEGYKVIRIGNAYKTIKGLHTYTIKYTYNIGKDPLKNFDELYFNLIGDEWDTIIDNISFNIKMPKGFDRTLLGFSSGKIGSTYNSNISYTVNGNIISGKVNGALNAGEALTVRVKLPEGYFVGAGHDIDKFSVFVIMLCLGFVLISYKLWAKYGKDDQVIETVEFYPPEGYNSAEIGFLYKGTTDTESVVSLLIYLANKGYLKIEETGEYEGLDEDDKIMKIIKLKEYDGDNDNEREFFNGLFAMSGSILWKADNIKDQEELKGNEISWEEAKERAKEDTRTYVTTLELKNSMYKTVENIEENIKEVYKDKILAKTTKGKTKWLILMIIAIFLLITIKPIYEYGTAQGELFAVGIIFGGIAFAAMTAIWLSENGIAIKIFITIWGGLFGGIPWGFSILPCLLQNSIYLITYFIGIISMVGIVVCVKYMPKRTKFGIEILGKLEGFKRFLETAEKEQLESLVMENPEYFYNILPYTYALEVSDKWISQFEKIALQQPNWYNSHSGFDFDTFSKSMKSTIDTMERSAISSSSGGSSSGGSSGGGSSGGGSGGGGGGSW